MKTNSIMKIGLALFIIIVGWTIINDIIQHISKMSILVILIIVGLIYENQTK